MSDKPRRPPQLPQAILDKFREFDVSPEAERELLPLLEELMLMSRRDLTQDGKHLWLLRFAHSEHGNWLEHPDTVEKIQFNEWTLADVFHRIRAYERLRDFMDDIDHIAVEVQHYIANGELVDPRWAPRLRQLLADDVDVTLDNFLPLSDQDSSPTQGG